MKVRINMTLDVDADAWAEEYALDKDEVREDVKQAALVAVRDGYLRDLGLVLNGEVK